LRQIQWTKGEDMTVKQLMRKLSKCPEDAEIVITNKSDYIPGAYIATGIIYDEDENQVEVESNYEKLVYELDF
jgi:hypothetical protein